MVIVETYPDQPSHDRPEPTPMASLAQILANQANAARSTGPKTAEGKDASRRNALKHGMAAEKLVLPHEEVEVIAARIVAWTPSFQPQDAYGGWLVEQLVVSSVQVEQCQAHANSLRTVQAARATLCWQTDRACDAEDLGASLGKAPATVARRLRATRQGCDWLLSRWVGLGRVLEVKGGWDEAQTRLALDMLGIPKELRDGPTPLDGDRSALIQAQVGPLEALRADALDELDEHDRAAAAVGLGRDTDKALALVRRYEAASLRRMQWAQKQLMAARAAAAPAPAPSPVKTATAPQPAAAPVPQEDESEEAELARWQAEFAEEDRMMAELEAELEPSFAAAASTARSAESPRGNRKARRALKARARKR